MSDYQKVLEECKQLKDILNYSFKVEKKLTKEIKKYKRKNEKLRKEIEEYKMLLAVKIDNINRTNRDV